jgi:hypothetical protein
VIELATSITSKFISDWLVIRGQQAVLGVVVEGAVLEPLAPASARPARTTEFFIFVPREQSPAVFRSGELSVVESPAFRVNVGLLVGQKETVGGQMEDARETILSRLA